MAEAVDYGKARRHLMRADPVLGAIVRRHGRCDLADDPDEPRFVALTRSLISQQLSTKAAATIFGRFEALFADEGGPAPEAILRMPLEALRAVGLSRQKAGYLRDLSERVIAGSLRLDRLDHFSDERVMAELTAVKGIGRWTAEMVLIFQLRRPDILPVDDVGMLRSLQRVYDLRRRPSASRVLRMGECWRPYRSIAAWYLWAELDGE